MSAPGGTLVGLGELRQLTGYGRSAAYAAMRDGLLPRPVKLGRASRWPARELLEVRAALLRGDDDEARRALVRRLHAQRGGALLGLARA